MPKKIRRSKFELLESRRLLAQSPEFVVEHARFCYVGLQSTANPEVAFVASGECGVNNGAIHLWRTDGTGEGTYDLGGRRGDGVDAVFESDGHVYWSVVHWYAPGGGSFHRSDGTPDSAQFISSDIDSIVELNGQLLFVPQLHSNDLRRITKEGSESLVQFESKISNLTRLNDVAIFWASGQVWRTDGTREGTVAIAEIPFNNQVDSSRPVTVMEGKDRVVLSGPVGRTMQTWSTDGTRAGTRKLPLNDVPSRFTVGGNRIVWPSSRDGLGVSITDGESVVELFELDEPQELWYGEEVDGTLYLLTSGNEIWMTDGTTLGSRKLAEFKIETNPLPFFVANSRFLFVTSSGSNVIVVVDRISGETTRYHLGFQAIAKVTPNAVMFLPRLSLRSGLAPVPWIWPNGEIAPMRLDSLAVSFEKHLLNLEDGVLFRGSSASSGDGYYFTDGTRENTYKVSEFVQRFDDQGREISETLFDDRFLQVGSDTVVFAVSEREWDVWARMYAFDLRRPDELESDVNGDDEVDFADFLVLSENFAQHDKSFSEGDLDGDGQVTVRDFQILRREFGARSVSMP